MTNLGLDLSRFFDVFDLKIGNFLDFFRFILKNLKTQKSCYFCSSVNSKEVRAILLFFSTFFCRISTVNRFFSIHAWFLRSIRTWLVNFWTIFSQFWYLFDPLFWRFWSINWQIFVLFFLILVSFWLTFFTVLNDKFGNYWTIFSPFWYILDSLFWQFWSTN